MASNEMIKGFTNALVTRIELVRDGIFRLVFVANTAMTAVNVHLFINNHFFNFSPRRKPYK